VQQLAVAEVSSGGAMWGVGERGRWLEVQDEAKSDTVLFIAEVRRFRRRNIGGGARRRRRCSGGTVVVGRNLGLKWRRQATGRLRQAAAAGPSLVVCGWRRCGVEVL
jgi:hypothetical protein